jgi:hypothetical protein
MPGTAQITLDLDFTPYLSRRVGVDPESGETLTEPMTMEDVVLDAAVARVVAGLDQEIRKELGGRVRAIRDEIIRDAVAPIIEEALSGEIIRTNGYGEPTGQPTTLREIITKDAQAALKLVPRANRGTRSSYDMTPATKVMEAEVDRVVTAEVKAIVQQVKDETRDAIREAAATQIAAAATSA